MWKLPQSLKIKELINYVTENSWEFNPNPDSIFIHWQQLVDLLPSSVYCVASKLLIRKLSTILVRNKCTASANWIKAKGWLYFSGCDLVECVIHNIWHTHIICGICFPSGMVSLSAALNRCVYYTLCSQQHEQLMSPCWSPFPLPVLRLYIVQLWQTYQPDKIHSCMRVPLCVE